jgi:RimJ/RimL family protein N-acetyltransferase
MDLAALTFTPLSAGDARAIQAWRYEPPYSIYNMGSDGAEPDEGLEELLDRHSPYYAVRDRRGELVGFFNFGTSALVWQAAEPALYVDGRTIAIGLGLRPDLTGQGLGLGFLDAGLAFAREQFAPLHFRLYVLTSNGRAIRVYERAGFRRVRTFVQRNIHGEHEYLEMARDP